MTLNQRKNCGRLALLLRDMPKDRLAMESFIAPDFDPGSCDWGDGYTDAVVRTLQEVKAFATTHQCGTTCCALGLAASSSVVALQPKKRETWQKYARRVFAAEMGDGEAWVNLFSSELESKVTPASLAARLAYVALGETPAAVSIIRPRSKRVFTVPWAALEAFVNA